MELTKKKERNECITYMPSQLPLLLIQNG